MKPIVRDFIYKLVQADPPPQSAAEVVQFIYDKYNRPDEADTIFATPLREFLDLSLGDLLEIAKRLNMK